MQLTELFIHDKLCKATDCLVLLKQTLPSGIPAYATGSLSYCDVEQVWEVYVGDHTYYPEHERLPTRIYLLPS